MNILGVIPARGGSKGVLRKNIKLLAGRPLLEYTAISALNSKYLTKVVLSSEDDEIIKYAKQFGIEVPFVRPINIAGDHTPTLQVIKHAYDYFLSIGEHYDAICILQVTTPFRSAEEIDKAIEIFYESGADSLISVRTVPHEYNPHWCFEPDSNNFLKIATGESVIIPQRQLLPVTYYRDGSIYIVSKDVLLSNSLLGKKVSYFLSEGYYHVNIDTMDDWEKAEKIIKEGYIK